MNDDDPVYTASGLIGFAGPKPKRTRLPVVDDGEGNERPDLCAPCGGKCCENFPGIPHPDDLGAPDEEALRVNVRALLATGRWCVASDGWTGWGPDAEPAFWYLRPKIRDGEERTFHGLGYHDQPYGPCTFHGASGCEIYEQRPRGCRQLVPDADPKQCKPALPRNAAFDAWEPYAGILLELS